MALQFGFEAEDIILEGRITQDEITKLKEMLKDEKIPKLTDQQIVLFILSCDRDLDFTIRTIKEYYTARCNSPEFFTNRDVELPELKKQLEVVEFSIFPVRTPEGCAILFHRLHDTYFSHYNMEESMKLLFMTHDAALYKHPPTGIVMLFDMQGVGLLHLSRIKMGLVKKFAHYLQEALPVKLKEIHIMNTQYFIDKIMFLIKPFMKKELLEQLHFHLPDVNMDEFNEKYLPKNCLPSDFGGTLPNTRILHEENTRILASLKSHFDDEEAQRIEYYGKKK